MNIAELLHYLNKHHDTTYALHRKCDGGTRGAYEVFDARGRRAILKFGHDSHWLARLRQAERIAEHLRGVGYPTPRNLLLGTSLDGWWYQIQEFIDGTPMSSPLSSADLDHLIALNGLQAAQHLSPESGWTDWSQYAHDVVFAGASGWTDAIRTFSPATRELLAALQECTEPFATASLSTADVVHGDFLPENVLVRGGKVAAVIDFAAAGCGARVLDLARLLGLVVRRHGRRAATPTFRSPRGSLDPGGVHFLPRLRNHRRPGLRNRASSR